MGPNPLTAGLYVPLASGATEWSRVLAMVFGVAFLAAVSLTVVRNRYNRGDMDATHAAVILSQLNTFGGSKDGVVIRELEALDDPDTIADIRGRFTGDPSSQPKALSAAWTVISEVGAELGSRTPNTSTVPARAVQEAILTAILGALAIVPVAAWKRAASTGGATVPTLGDFVAGGEFLIDVTIAAVTAIPYSGALFGFAMSFGILGANTLWTLWFLPPVVLTALAAAYYWMSRRVESDHKPTGPSIYGWTRRFVTLAAIGWFVGATLTTVGGLTPHPAARAGLAAALAVITVGLYVFLTRTDPADVREDRADGEQDAEPEDEPDSDPLARPSTDDDGEDTLSDLFAGTDPDRDAEHSDSDGMDSLFPEDDRVRDPDSDADHRDVVVETDPDAGSVWNSVRVAGTTVADHFRAAGTRLAAHVHGVDWKRALYFGILALGFGHEALAFLAVTVVTGTVAYIWTRRTLNRWKHAADTHGRDALWLDIIHSVTVTAGALTLPLLIGYGAVAIGTGKIVEVGAVVLAAPSETTLAVAFLGIVTALAVAVVFADRFRDVRRGIRRALSVQSVRTILMVRAFPVILSAILGILFLAFGISPLAAVAGALAIGTIARIAFMTYNYLTYRRLTRDSGKSVAGRVVINGRKVEDRDGEPVFIADVNGHRTAHRRLDTLIGQIKRDARSLLTEGHPEQGSFPRYYYRHGIRRGKVDMDSVASELAGDVLTRFRANVRQTDASGEDIRKKLHSEYPSHVVKRVVKDLKQRNRVRERDGEYEWVGGTGT